MLEDGERTEMENGDGEEREMAAGAGCGAESERSVNDMICHYSYLYKI